jgi:hypothetical protein
MKFCDSRTKRFKILSAAQKEIDENSHKEYAHAAQTTLENIQAPPAVHSSAHTCGMVDKCLSTASLCRKPNYLP